MRVCAVCKAEIEADRCQAIPATRLCALHGREIEQFGGEFTVIASQERTSKQGSLKLDYGGIATSATRNEDAWAKLRDEYEKQQKAKQQC